MSTSRSIALRRFAAVPPLAATLSSASALEIKASDVHAMDYPTTQAIEYRGQLLNARRGGRMSIEIFHSMQLGGEKVA